MGGWVWGKATRSQKRAPPFVLRSYACAIVSFPVKESRDDARREEEEERERPREDPRGLTWSGGATVLLPPGQRDETSKTLPVSRPGERGPLDAGPLSGPWAACYMGQARPIFLNGAAQAHFWIRPPLGPFSMGPTSAQFFWAPNVQRSFLKPWRTRKQVPYATCYARHGLQHLQVYYLNCRIHQSNDPDGFEIRTPRRMGLALGQLFSQAKLLVKRHGQTNLRSVVFYVAVVVAFPPAAVAPAFGNFCILQTHGIHQILIAFLPAESAIAFAAGIASRSARSLLGTPARVVHDTLS
ncbi:hypothetical protein NL676_016636 [Syzygium grande]|nr:hypothetical protein NL676_016636 [Syzygium grande]